MSLHAAGRREWIVVGLLLGVASGLLFARLDDRLLWQDEAETALLAESVLREGLPTAFDGRNLISQEGQQEFSPPDYRWYWTPWLQHYVTAASFALLGPSTFSARLPFVLFGLGTLLLAALLARRLCRDPWAPAWAVLILATSVPFLLHVRQCRYYALAGFFGLLMIHEYLRVLEGRRGASAGLVLAATGLFHSHYVVFAGFAFGLGLHFLVRAREDPEVRSRWLRIAQSAAVMIALATPFLIGFAGHSSGQALPGPSRSLTNALEAIPALNRFVLPLVLALVAIVIAAIRHGRPHAGLVSGEAPGEDPHTGLLLLAVFAGNALLISLLMPWFFFRYYVPLIPVAALLQVLLIDRVMGLHRASGLALLVLLAATDLPARTVPLGSAPPDDRVRSLRTGDETAAEVVGPWAGFLPLTAYLHEIAHERTGPLEAVVDHLRKHARPGDTLIATYGDLPLQFYTDLKVVGGLSLEDPEPHLEAEWLLVRTHTHRQGDARLKRFIADRFRREDYRVERLEPLDTPYENRPDPDYHKFRDPSEGLPAVKLWRRLEDVSDTREAEAP